MAECDVEPTRIGHMHNPHSGDPQAGPSIDPTSVAAWQDILQRVADDIDQVVDDFLAELRGSSLYEDGLVAHADLRHTAHETFRYLLDEMLARPMSPHQQGAAKRLGIRRADQKIQLEDLMAAIRLDFIVLWRRMRTIITADEMPVLVDHTEILLTTIEQYIGEVQLEFVAETARIARDTRLATERHLARLLNTTQLSQPSIERIAQGLGVSVADQFDVVVIHDSAVVEAQEALSESLSTGQILGSPYGSGYGLIQPAGSSPRLWQRSAQYAGGYVAAVAGLGQVPTVMAALHALLQFHAQLPKMLSADELWPAAVADTLTGLLPGFPHRYILGLQELPAPELADVLAAVESFLRTGSVKATADAIARHRNTVINRLKVFETATGLDVKVPRDAVLATLVLATPALRQQT